MAAEQTVTNPSRAVHVYNKGRKGLVNYAIRECSLRIWPSLANKVFVYHSSLVCRAKRQPQ